MAEKRTVGVVGLGHVGAHVAFCLGMMGVADEILLCDVNEQKAISECQDLNDAVMYMPNHSVYRVVDYRGLKNADIIVNAVGDVSLCATGNRDDELGNSVRQVADYIPKVMAAGFNGIFVTITNPCDVIAHLIAKLSGLPRGRVVGTGTLLDSSRLVHAISDQTGLDARGFFAFMMGGTRKCPDGSLVPGEFLRPDTFPDGKGSPLCLRQGQGGRKGHQRGLGDLSGQAVHGIWYRLCCSDTGAYYSSR